MFRLGDAMSIFARSVFSPSANLPSFICTNSLRFSSTLRSRVGLGLRRVRSASLDTRGFRRRSDRKRRRHPCLIN